MTASPFQLEGKTVLISGAGGGIGGALVQTFAEAGARVTGTDQGLPMLEHLDLEHRLTFDLSDIEATSAALKAHIDQQGAPDIVISNAGFTRAERFEDVTTDNWQSEMAINLNGVYAMTAPIVEAMAQRGSGSLVFISSVNGLAHYGNPAYAAAKAGMLAYAKAIAVERGGRGVRANVICPGSVRTTAWDHRLADNPRLLDNVLPHYPLGRLVIPQEVANTALFLASPMASGITGAVLPVDGGLTAGNLRFVTDVLGAAQTI
ncbi:SDR family oxidoreductase [Devosia rhodophyticola]|uniref:SDR family oxidoreductase n=1 Tax=Devosia rhodophyticola TaxID=3026423 RepID=A0ABY7YXG3_9HYPH|nr:SDR family oxidoreductase [Devosia rhodophyticola]WDR05862.1 SDR family oxidoreductase [Devosia rhodophyticola]